MEDSKKHKRVLENLMSTDQDTVLRTIKDLRDTGDQQTLAFLIDLYSTNPSTKVREEIERYLRDLKDQSSAVILSEAIKNPKHQHIRKNLVSYCWQSRVHFADQMSVFSEIAIEGDYQESIEAFTVLEESAEHSTLKQIEKEIHYLESNKSKVREEKQPLIDEIIKSLKQAI